MNAKELNAHRLLRRVLDFVDAHPIPELASAIGKQRSEIEAVLAALSQKTVDQDAGIRLTEAATKNQLGLRESLWQKYMLPVSRLARELFGVTGVDKALKMPAGTVAHERVVTAARSMAEAAAKYEAEFVQHGMPADFIQAMRDAAQRLEDTFAVKVGTRRRRRYATTAVYEQIKRGRRAVRVLNAILTRSYQGDRDLLATWDSIRKFQPVASAEETAAPITPVTPLAPTPAPSSKAA